jgi:hypothetical protein
MRMGEALGRGDPRGMAILEKWRSLQTSTDPAIFSADGRKKQKTGMTAPAGDADDGFR